MCALTKQPMTPKAMNQPINQLVDMNEIEEKY